MKTYLKNNIKPILIGIIIGISYMVILKSIEDIIVKIELIKVK